MITPGLALDLDDLDRLDTYLSSSEVGDEVVMMSELDGCLTAICLRRVRSRRTASTKTVVTDKIGPNAPCPCGSGKKYKRCCGAN